LLVAAAATAAAQATATQAPSSSSTAPAAGTIAYTVSLHDPARHLVHISMQVPPGATTRKLQLPVWNGLYEVKDFAQYIVDGVTAVDRRRHALPIHKTDKTTWEVSNAAAGFDLHYDFYANEAGPFGAQLDREHAFFNLAWFLMYPVGGRK
jgi:predicted metalloprotease with PDZ domain